ncbi:thialysine N-epsilon-acetyltransferase-like isoform X2 [Festucalex cinctus]
MNFNIRAASQADCKDISRMLMDLAVHDNMLDQVEISCEDLQRDGFSQNPSFECIVAEVPEENKSKEGKIISSSWKGRSMYLESLYVMPEFRGFGIGTGLMSTVAKVAKEKQCVRFQLHVLDKNTPSRGFYAARGGQDLTDKEGWHLIRFHGQSLDRLANETAKS